MFKRTVLILFLAALGAQSLHAQRPVFRRTLPEEKRSKVGFSARMLFNVDLNLHDLGTVGFPTLIRTNDLEGRKEYDFSDGRIYIDDQAQLPSHYSFLYQNATIETLPGELNPGRQSVTAFSMTNFASESTGASAMADSGARYGWEITYQYQWGKTTDRVRFGVMAGIGFNQLKFDYQGVVQGNVITKVFQFRPTAPIPYDPNTSGSRYEGNGEGTGIADLEDFDPEDTPAQDYLYWDGSEWVSTSNVETAFSYDGILATLRVGPTVSLRVIDDLRVELSAGLIGAFLDSRIVLNQTLLNLPILPDSDNFDDFEKEDSELLYGFFAEGLMSYQMTDRVGFYGGLMYVNLSDPKNNTVGTVRYDLSLQSPMLASAGMRLTF